MTSHPLQEAPHFRGKTLTPESPVPVHVPEPQNIPVLMNQTDLAFNDMSTHMEQRYPPQHTVMTQSYGAQDHLSDMVAQAPQHDTSTESYGTQDHLSDMIAQTEVPDNPKSGQDVGSTLEGTEGYPDSSDDDGFALAYEGENTERQQGIDTSKNHLNAQHFVSNGAHASISNHAKVSSTSVTPSQNDNFPASNTQAIATLADQLPTAPVNQDPGVSVPQPPQDFDAHSDASNTDVNGDGVNYQALLDNLSASASAVPTSENDANTAAPPGSSSPGSAQAPIATFPIPAGLPPRPPPQEKPAIHPNYNPGEDIRTYHNPPAQNSTASTTYNPPSNNAQRPPQAYNQSNGVAPNGLPPPPLATFQQPLSNANQPQASPQDQQYRQSGGSGKNAARLQASSDGEDEYPRRPDTERLYEEFLRDEAIYVAEGTWDKFPQGSRLFIGNLFTEKVTKRDIFYVFHKYGRLAQISMKSAYGFVQYHDATSCGRALHSEQGIELRGRKIHLEISKPQKNTRNATATAAGDNLRAGYGRRSRSPDYTRGGSGWQGNQRPGGDRFDRNSISSNFERRLRDDYRPGMRSPSPRGFRGRGRSPDRYYRGRSRSPFDRNGHYRNRSPMGPDPDDEGNLPIMRRNPRDVPDVQLILVDEVDRTFVGYIQQSFRDRGLRCDVLQLPRVSLAAVVKRQVIEGVQAVVKIFRKSQNIGKIPLQVYNRSTGVDNVRFDDYEDLDANVAAELVVRAKTTHMAPAPAPQQYPQPPAYGAPSYPQPHQPMQSQHPQQLQAGGAPPNLANLITSLDGPALQKLLSAMSQTPQTPQTPSSAQKPSLPHLSNQQQDLSSLLQSVARQQPQQQPHQQPPQQAPQQPPQQGYAYGNGPSQQTAYGGPASSSIFGNNTGFAQQSGSYAGRPPPQNYPPPQQQLAGQQHNVQDMLAQLARYKQ